MTKTLVDKLLRDLRLPLIVVALLLAAFQCLWAKITQRVTEELLPQFTPYLPLLEIRNILFQGPGKLIQTLLGGDSIQFDHVLDMLSIGYVHPLVQAIFCIWAIGRAAGAIAGEVDRGTMELLLAQPVARFRLILAHFCIDLVTIPSLCLSLWAGTWLGTALVGMLELGAPADSQQFADPRAFGPALVNVAALLFAITGYTMWLSSRGRFRGRVMGQAVLVTLVMFLINVVGQLWDVVEPFRPLTVFYYYQPQQIILNHRWWVDVGPTHAPWFAVHGTLVLLGVGTAGYLLALWEFCRRDLPAPL
jgi:beta-exotoxin I transport system permease protein